MSFGHLIDDADVVAECQLINSVAARNDLSAAFLAFKTKELLPHTEQSPRIDPTTGQTVDHSPVHPSIQKETYYEAIGEFLTFSYKRVLHGWTTA